MGDAKNNDSYKQGGEGDDDGGGQEEQKKHNPTGRARKSSARTRGKKDRRLFGGTPWAKKKPDDPKNKK